MPECLPGRWNHTKENGKALPGVAQWAGHHLANRKVTESIPGQGTCLGCGPGPWLGVCERQLINVSHTLMLLFLPFLPPFPLSKNK